MFCFHDMMLISLIYTCILQTWLHFDSPEINVLCISVSVAAKCDNFELYVYFYLIILLWNTMWSQTLWSYKIYENEFCTRITKSSNQNAVFIVCDILIGCFSSTSTKFVLESFMTVGPDVYSFLILVSEGNINTRDIFSENVKKSFN